MKDCILLLKRFLASNKYFWKFRHIVQKNIFTNSYGHLPEKYFNFIFKDIEKQTILDFGCATGDKLVYFINNGSKNIYGVDINLKALNSAKYKVKKFYVNQRFYRNISLNDINQFLKSVQKQKFDLIILDRVMYILNDNEFKKIISIFTKITKYIYIDDFFLMEDNYKKKDRLMIKGYIHSDFNKILKNEGFELKFIDKSPYKDVLFSNSRSAVYKHKNVYY